MRVRFNRLTLGCGRDRQHCSAVAIAINLHGERA